MKRIDWIRKLTSRKLWTTIASFVSMMIVAMAGASVVAYIIGEELTDAMGTGESAKSTENLEQEE